MLDVVQISKNVLARLSLMDHEKDGGNSIEQLIFPKKIQEKGSKEKIRISEQELRLLFIEEFKKRYPTLFYSIETPTLNKYKVGKSYNTIKFDPDGVSALLDMCIFDRKNNNYDRILNIEFKHINRSIKRSGKDILKLLCEENDGAFIQLLDNTNANTLRNKKSTGVLDKLYQNFVDFNSNWCNSKKSIQIIIISLQQKTIISRIIKKKELNNLDAIFFQKLYFKDINEVKGNGWVTIL